MKKTIIYVLMVMIFGLVSCEDFLSKENKNGFDESTYMEFSSQAKEVVISIYDVLNYSGFQHWGFQVLGEAPSDNIVNDWGDGQWGPHVVNLYNYNWQGDNLFIVLRWNNAYKGIYRANYLLSKIDEVTDISDEDYNTYTGEALFLRAYYYYSLVIGFGDIPLLTEIPTPEMANSISKNPESEIWEQIVSDLEEATVLLPDTYDGDENLGRVTSGAAWGMLSRVYLWTKDYAGAVEAANEVESLGYGLVDGDEYYRMFNGTMKNSSESVFESQQAGEFGAWFSKSGAEGAITMHTSPRVSWARYLRPVNGTNNPAGIDLRDIFELADKRRKGSFLVSFEDSIDYGGVMGIYPDTSAFGDFRLDLQVAGAYNVRKYLPSDPANWVKGRWTAFSTNIPLIRFSEVLINKAEAQNELNNVAGAFSTIEAVRVRAGLDMTGISNGDQAAMKLLLENERRIEFLFEGHRWFDLKRWGKLNEALPAAGLNYVDGVHQYWPIPSQELSLNPGLGD